MRPEILLDVRAVSAMFGVDRATIYKWIRQGTFPAPIKKGRRFSRWIESDIAKYIEKLGAKRLPIPEPVPTPASNSPKRKGA